MWRMSDGDAKYYWLMAAGLSHQSHVEVCPAAMRKLQGFENSSDSLNLIASVTPNQTVSVSCNFSEESSEEEDPRLKPCQSIKLC